MYLHFQDYSQKLYFQMLDRRGMSHGDKIIKIFATEEDPRFKFNKHTLPIIQVSGEPFTDEVFNFGERGVYTGNDLEQFMQLNNFTPEAARVSRALFRFSIQNDTKFAYAAMSVKDREGNWVISHPLEEIDRITKVAAIPRQETTLHLDIFFTEALHSLQAIVNFRDPEAILSYNEIKNYEGQGRISKEKGN